MLRVYRFLMLVLGIAVFAVSGPTFAQREQRAQGYVLEVSGDVTGQVGTRSASRVGKGQTLVNNAVITTGPGSYAVLKFEDGTAVLLKENTSFRIQNYAYNPTAPENANAIFDLLRGGFRMITGLVTSGNRNALKVATPLATIGIRGTEFVAELVNPLYLQVISGACTLANSAGAVGFSAGQMGVVANSKTLGGLIPAGQVPAGVFQMPKVQLSAAPMNIPPGPAVGGGPVTGTVGLAIAGAVAAGAVILISNENDSATVVHH
jgi:hypothetical protein